MNRYADWFSKHCQRFLLLTNLHTFVHISSPAFPLFGPRNWVWSEGWGGCWRPSPFPASGVLCQSAPALSLLCLVLEEPSLSPWDSEKRPTGEGCGLPAWAKSKRRVCCRGQRRSEDGRSPASAGPDRRAVCTESWSVSTCGTLCHMQCPVNTCSVKLILMVVHYSFIHSLCGCPRFFLLFPCLWVFIFSLG